MLTVCNIDAVYSHAITALRGVSLDVPTGQIVCLLGGNGAGKSTTLKAISNLLHCEDGDLTEGEVHFGGQRIDTLGPEDIVELGIIHVLEGSQALKRLTVLDNLKAGAYAARSSRAAFRSDLERIYTYFPRLKERSHTVSGYCSGGERQMLVIARALMAHPKLLLLDEPSLGLSPIAIQEIYAIIKSINAEAKTSILLVEQNAEAALRISHFAYVLENGRVVLSGRAAELRQNADIREFYLGLTGIGDKKSYREAKRYPRPKRWLA